jgi:O-antigen/teichoic acid export membrane protein
VKGLSLSEKKSILNDTIIYSGGQFLGNIINAARGLVVAQLLGPALFSIWKSLQLILFYGKFSQLGSLSCMIKQIPYLRGQNKHEEVERLEKTAFAGSFWLSVVLGIILCLYAITVEDSVFRYGLYFISVILVLSQLYMFYIYYLTFERYFKLLSYMVLGYPIILITVQVYLVYRFGIYGIFWGMIIANALILIITLRRTPLRPTLYFKINELIKLIKSGFFIMMLEVMFYVLRYIDKVILISVIGYGELLGNYYMAAMLTEFFWYIPVAFGQVVNTRMIQIYGREKTLDAVRRHFDIAVRVFCWGTPFLIGLFYILIPIPLAILSQYWPAIGPARVLIFMVFFLAMINFQRNLFIAVKKQWLMMGNYIFVSVLLFICGYLAAHLDKPVISMAVVVTVCVALFISINYIMLLRMFNTGWYGAFVYLLKEYWPFLYMLLLLKILAYVFSDPLSPEECKWITILGMSLIYSLFYLPIMYMLFKMTNLSVSELLNMFKKGKAGA